MGYSAAVFCSIRAALKNPDISWSNKKNPEPWNEYADKNYQKVPTEFTPTSFSKISYLSIFKIFFFLVDRPKEEYSKYTGPQHFHMEIDHRLS